MHELLFDTLVASIDSLGDRLLILSHSLAELHGVFFSLGLLVRDTVEEVSKAEIKERIALVGDALSLGELLGPVLDSRVAMVDQRH